MSQRNLKRPTSSGSIGQRTVSRMVTGVNDSNQYKQYNVKNAKPGSCFPTSTLSDEFWEYENVCGEISRYLTQFEGIAFSTECVGRLPEGEEDPKTTVLIRYFELPSAEAQQLIREDLESMTKLLIEFVGHDFVVEYPEFWDLGTTETGYQ